MRGKSSNRLMRYALQRPEQAMKNTVHLSEGRYAKFTVCSLPKSSWHGGWHRKDGYIRNRRGVPFLSVVNAVRFTADCHDVTCGNCLRSKQSLRLLSNQARQKRFVQEHAARHWRGEDI